MDLSIIVKIIIFFLTSLLVSKFENNPLFESIKNFFGLTIDDVTTTTEGPTTTTSFLTTLEPNLTTTTTTQTTSATLSTTTTTQCSLVCGLPLILNSTICTCVCPDVPAFNATIKRWNTQLCLIECINDQSSSVPIGFQWNPDTCTQDCILTNDNCTAPQIINTASCQCVCPDPPVFNATIKQWNTQLCLVECINDQSSSVPIGFQWNPDTCTQDCILTNNNCTAPQIINTASCQCKCPQNMQEPTDYNTTIKYWDAASCSLKCLLTLTCPGSQQFLTDTCSCGCNPAQPAVIPLIKRWDDLQCKLVCISSPISCFFQGQTWSEDLCACSCPNEATTTCVSPQFFDPRQGCKCVNPCFALPPLFGCPESKYWSFDSCQCMCINENPTCDVIKMWNSQTCNCDCKTTTVCDSFKFFNPDSCACQCITSPPTNGCSTNLIWFDSLCSCKCFNHFTDRPTCIQSTVHKWNSRLCKCECKKAPVCNAAIHTTNLATCSCDCIAPVTSCPPLLTWSRRTCSCALF